MSKTRKTRFVCVSDTHNATPQGSFKMPKGDVLIHAGDLTNQGTFAELQKTVKWIEEADFEVKIVIAGNHDITLDTAFYNQYGLYFHNQDPQDTEKCQKLLEQSPSILYLRHGAANVKLSASDGPRTKFKIFGSPYSPAFGLWAFGYQPGEAHQIWDRIPLDSDVVVTHGPSKYHCDETSDRRAAGCEALRSMLWRVRPRLAICGHIHEARGAEVVQWDLGISNIKYKEAGVERWNDPGRDNKRISLIDLTKKGGKMIANDGSVGDAISDIVDDDATLKASEVKPTANRMPQQSSVFVTQSESVPASSIATKESRPTLGKGLSHVATSLLAGPGSNQLPATQGQGGSLPSQRCDLEALSGRLGRKETCVINAAIMASSWPHNQNGGKKFNKPIVVDIDLPVWTE